MIISRSKILKVPSTIKPDKKYYITVTADGRALERLGLKEFKEGMLIQPPIECGIISKRNVFGYSVPNKKLPKESRFIRTVYWEWQLYNGDWQSDYRDIYKDCYPRIEYEPFGIEMKSIVINNTPMFITKVKNHSNIKNVINLYLEVFGYCRILDDNLKLANEKIDFNRCNWEILPPDIKLDIKNIKSKSIIDRTRKRKDYDEERINTLEKYKPQKRFVGKNGFQGYYAFLYNQVCVLESPIYGNATYIIPIRNWEELSKLTKAKLINSGNLINRIEHNKEWFNNIGKNIK